MSSIINKVKDALHSDKDKTHESPEGTHGPHSSKTANAADPRVDSDRDHRGNPTAGTTGYGHDSTTGHSTHTGAHTSGLTGTTGHNTHTGTGAYGSSGTTEGIHGPHGSKVANAADPRVDSDRDHRGAPGNTFGSGTHTTGAHTTGTHSSGLTSTTGHNTHTGTGAFGSSGTTEGNHGPHDSKFANTVDPRVDSDRDHRGAPGNTFGSGTHTTGTHSSGLPGTTGHNTHTGTGAYGSTTGAGAYGSGAPEGTHGPHGSRAANAADPRIDSDADHRAQHHLPGPASNTAGPHKSDALNKVDPRVDSDLDGSKTYAGNKTNAY